MSVAVSRVMDALEAIAPIEFAEPWDNVGLLVGSPRREISGCLLTIDLTESVLDEAISHGSELIIAYHPPIFHPLTSLTDRTVAERIVLRAAQAGMAIYSPHTALDAAPGGVNDWLAEGLGSGDIQALEHRSVLPESEAFKIVTFAPHDAVQRIREAMSTTGAGCIGDYSQCSFELAGSGTFLGGSSTDPVVGQRGELERVDEIRLEMVCSKRSLGLAVMALRRFHPYEEPPIEIYALHPRPQRDIGMGRRVVLDQKVTFEALAERVKERLGVSRLRLARPEHVSEQVGTIGLCAGAGGALLGTAVERDCEVFITGEMKHHEILAALADRCAVIVAGHTNTERGYLRILRDRLAERLGGLDLHLAETDRDPLQPV